MLHLVIILDVPFGKQFSSPSPVGPSKQRNNCSGGMLMRNLFTCLFSLFLILAFTGQSFAQQTQAVPATSGNSASPVPRLIKFSGVLLDHQGQPLKGPVGVTFSLYSQQSGDSPLLMEAQNVELHETGGYTVFLDSNTRTGLPQ